MIDGAIGASPDQRWRMVTLTLKSSKAPLKAQLKSLRSFFRRLRQRAVWKKAVTGGIAVIEVTFNRTTLEWHPHLHVVCTGEYIPRDGVVKDWKEITGGSWLVDIRKIESGEKASGYLSRYLTAPPDPAVMDDTDLFRQWYEALKGAHWCIRIGGLKVKIEPAPENVDPGDWVQICSVAELHRRAAAGEPTAVRLLDLLWEGRGEEAHISEYDINLFRREQPP
jgi:hypothetical protein